MRNRRGSARRGTPAAIALLASLPLAGAAMAYTVVTRDGHRVEVQARPEVKGLQAWMRLQPTGRLAILPEDQIDWEATQAANPVTPPIAVPSSTILTVAPEAPSRPIELKLTGSPASRQTAQGAEGGKPNAPGPGSDEQKRINAQEAVIKLQKEYAQVAAARDQETAHRKSLEEELALLQARDVGYASETSSAQQRMRELQQQISESSARIGQLETRLADIRTEVVQLGGSIE